MDMDGGQPTSFIDDDPPGGCRGLLVTLLITTAGVTIGVGLLVMARTR